MKQKSLNVMIVDDSPVVLEHLRYLLERAGHKVSTRDSALGTVALVMKTRPNVLVLDVSMPALDGDRLASVISELRRDIVLILHSSMPERDLRALAKSSGAHGVIQKTHDAKAFLAEFHRIAFGEPMSFISKRGASDSSRRGP